MYGDNYGISHSGTGDILNNGTQAFGPDTQAYGAPQQLPTPSPTDLIEALRDLLHRFEADLSLDQQSNAHQQLEIVSSQLARPADARDKGLISRALARLVAAVGTVTTLATSADQLRQALERLIS